MDIPYSDIAILYRTNAQSRVFEEKFVIKNIPYKIIGGVNFYQRKEIKDLISYLKVVHNGQDDLAVKRIINVPKRSIGATSVEKIQEYALGRNISFLDAVFEADQIMSLGKAATKVLGFKELIEQLREKQETMLPSELFTEILETTGYIKELEAEDTEEAKGRIENIDELLNKIVAYEETAENPDLGELLEEIALVADIDGLETDNNNVVLMTLHSAKGLEFPYVFLCGMEDGMFPSYMTIVSEDPTEIEEERRLCYVGITRAKEKLYLSAARKRMIRGQSQFNKVSRFIDEIPKELLKLDHPMDEIEKEPESKLSFGPKHQYRNPYQVNRSVPTKASGLEYTKGDTVSHSKFGPGVVLDIVSGGKDYEVTVQFNRCGVKKMFASFAKLKKI